MRTGLHMMRKVLRIRQLETHIPILHRLQVRGRGEREEVEGGHICTSKRRQSQWYSRWPWSRHRRFLGGKRTARWNCCWRVSSRKSGGERRHARAQESRTEHRQL